MSPEKIPLRGEPRSTAGRQWLDKAFVNFCVTVASVSVVVLAVLLLAIVFKAAQHFLPISPQVVANDVGNGVTEVIVRGTPTGGTYAIIVQPPSDQSAEPKELTLAFDADHDTVKSALQESADDVHVETTGNSPNFRHRITLSQSEHAPTFSTVNELTGQNAVARWIGMAKTFVMSPPSPSVSDAGVWPAMFGTVWVCLVCAIFALPIGVGTAILMEEFKPQNRWLMRLHGFVQLNISNLAGVPSVVYGILGLTAFVSLFGLLGSPNNPSLEFGVQYYDQFVSEGGYSLQVPTERGAEPTVPKNGMDVFINEQRAQAIVIEPGAPVSDDKIERALTLRSNAEAGSLATKSWYYFRLPFGRGVFAGALTLMLVILPIVIISTQEALRGVPDSLRDAAFGMGASRWQTVWLVTLPASIPGIMTGSILAMSRAIGEAAPVLIICGVVYITSAPRHLMDSFTVISLQIYDWAGRPEEEFRSLAAVGIVVLLTLLLFINGIAVFIRQKAQKPVS